MNGWMDGWINGWVQDGWVDGWKMDGWMDGWVDGWMDGWVGVLLQWHNLLWRRPPNPPKPPDPANFASLLKVWFKNMISTPGSERGRTRTFRLSIGVCFPRARMPFAWATREHERAERPWAQELVFFSSCDLFSRRSASSTSTCEREK
jgi:hypothetical protein